MPSDYEKAPPENPENLFAMDQKYINRFLRYLRSADKKRYATTMAKPIKRWMLAVATPRILAMEGFEEAVEDLLKHGKATFFIDPQSIEESGGRAGVEKSFRIFGKRIGQFIDCAVGDSRTVQGNLHAILKFKESKL